MKTVIEFLRQEAGQDGVEYALLIGFVTAAAVAGTGTFTTAFTGFWTSAASGINKAAVKAAM